MTRDRLLIIATLIFFLGIFVFSYAINLGGLGEP
jgi:Na+/H+ antiporter NhaD/arsenite permease-like protein